MDRNILLSLIAAATLVACTNDSHNTITLNVEGGAGKTAYLERFEAKRTIVLDSVKLNGQGEGKLKATSLPLDFYRITLPGEEQLILVMDSTENPVVTAKSGQLDNPASITGSRHSEALHRFQTDVKTFEAQRDELRQRIATEQDQSSGSVDALNALSAAFYEASKQFVQENSASPVAITALSRLSMQRDLELFKQVRGDLRKTMPSSIFFTQFRETVDRVEQQELAMKLQEEEAKRLANLLPIGGEAPEIRQQTPAGGSFALSELRGKVVLIDFWASWCKPCRFENPAMKRVYDKYKGKGFEILGVSLDRSQDAWVQAIQADGINWKHVSDLGFWNNAAAQEYGVSSIPFTVLLDREGRIIEKGLRSAELDLALARILGS